MSKSKIIIGVLSPLLLVNGANSAIVVDAKNDHRRLSPLVRVKPAQSTTGNSAANKSAEIKNNTKTNAQTNHK